MEPQDLVKVWNAPDNSKLTSKQLSIRLPILVAARISALCEMYPRKTKTEIIGDLLSTALDQLVTAIPSVDGQLLGVDPHTNEPYHEEIGPRGHFYDLTQKYLKELENETEVKEPTPLSKKTTTK